MRSVCGALCVATLGLGTLLGPPADGQPAPGAAKEPRFLNLVYQALRPGRAPAYAEIERRIARDYARFSIPAYWIALQSITGQPVSLSLNLFNSFDEAQRAVTGIATVPRLHPALDRLQAELLENIADERTILTVRRDDIEGASPAVNLAASMRLLRITTFTVMPGHEDAVASALRAACAESGAASPAAACLVFEADAGVSSPTFVLLSPLASLADVGRDITNRHALRSAGGGPAAADLSSGSPRGQPEMACGSACSALESQIYVVNPEQSHVPSSFAAGDPTYWGP